MPSPARPAGDSAAGCAKLAVMRGDNLPLAPLSGGHAMRRYALLTAAIFAVIGTTDGMAAPKRASNSNTPSGECKERLMECLRGCGNDNGCKTYCSEVVFPKCTGNAAVMQTPAATTTGGAAKPKATGGKLQSVPAATK
jgi:hypothetical protein